MFDFFYLLFRTPYYIYIAVLVDLCDELNIYDKLFLIYKILYVL